MSWSEDRLHRWLARRAPPRALAGSHGHDAAVLRRLGGRPVLCVDQTVAGVHYRPGLSPARVGAKAAGRAISDLAAAAAEPRGVLLALAAPAEAAEARLRGLIEGVERRAGDLGAELLGGDLCCTPGPESLCVTALGVLPGRRRPPGRDRARPGQLVLLTGPVGGSGGGRHLAIEPRLAAGRWLHALGATALMDVSDGLALDLRRIARASAVRIELEHVPVHPDARRAARSSGRTPRWHALHDGEDHELIATLSPAAARRALAEAPERCPELTVIGRVRREEPGPTGGAGPTGAGLWLADPSGALEPWSPGGKDAGGWIHGGG